MRFDRRTTRSHGAALATTASALVALVAVAAAMSSLPGTSVRAALLESRGTAVEAPTVRAVAAAVAAAARELVGTETITAALPADHFAGEIAVPIRSRITGFESQNIIRSRPIAERLIDLPPPAC